MVMVKVASSRRMMMALPRSMRHVSSGTVTPQPAGAFSGAPGLCPAGFRRSMMFLVDMSRWAKVPSRKVVETSVCSTDVARDATATLAMPPLPKGDFGSIPSRVTP